MKIDHRDMGLMGSQFTFVHDPLMKRVSLVIPVAVFLSAAAFSHGLHLLEKKSLATWSLVLAVLLVLVFVFKLYSKVYSERVIILPSLGLQLETQYYFGQVSTHFIDLSQIKDIIINEAVTMNSVLTYLVVVLGCGGQTSQPGSLFPLFSHSGLSVDDLKCVYQVCQQKLVSSQTR